MQTRHDGHSDPASQATPGTPDKAHEPSPASSERERPADGHATEPATPVPAAKPAPSRRKWFILCGIAIAVVVAAIFIVPWLITALNTVSTDDAYVNGHVTFVAPRVAGQVTEVLVDDNYRVKRGDLLVQLDKEPYEVQVAIKKAAVEVAQTNLAAAWAQVRGQVAQARANRFKLEHSIEDVNNQIANLRAAVATLNRQKANLRLAQANLKRGEELAPSGGVSKEDLDTRRLTVEADQAAVDQALQQVYAIRVSLGLPAQPPKGNDLGEVPPDLDQNFSTVREALGELIQSAVLFGYMPTSWNSTPKQAIADFYKQDPQGNLDRIYARIIPQAPAIKQAEANLAQARRDLAQAELNLRYCKVYSDIDGVVTRRNVNPGNNVQVGQNLMAVRALRPPDLWVDANFKETQLAYLRIGQRVRLEVDMYGSRREFEGRISGFTMGTGQTLALLPPQNATGNFVKIVQRLPVRIELINYDPNQEPLFVGLSVVPYVYYKETPTGPDAGKFLQPNAPLPQGSYPKTLQELEQPSAPTAPATQPPP
jgi:membrane fusion protein (multidrug efflux system)